MSRPLINVDALTPAERLRLLDEVWESLSRDPANVPVTDAQREELDRRLVDLEANVQDGLTLDDALARVRSSKH